MTLPLTWTEITQPAVGDKITAAGFGTQVYTASNELQDQADLVVLRDCAAPGREATGITRTGPTAVTTGAGITTVVTAPAGGTTRVVKGLFLHAATAVSTATITLNATVLGVIDFASAGIAQLDCTIPLTSTDTNGLRITMTGGTGYVTATYIDRTDALVTRLGLANGSTSGTLVASGTARTVTELWIGNPSTSTAATATVGIGGSDFLHAYPVPAKGIVIVDMPIPITNAQAITWAGDSTTALTYMAVGH